MSMLNVQPAVNHTPITTVLSRGEMLWRETLTPLAIRTEISPEISLWGQVKYETQVLTGRDFAQFWQLSRPPWKTDWREPPKTMSQCWRGPYLDWDCLIIHMPCLWLNIISCQKGGDFATPFVPFPVWPYWINLALLFNIPHTLDWYVGEGWSRLVFGG